MRALTDMTRPHFIACFFLYVVTFSLLQPVVSQAMDPRFELEENEIRKESLKGSGKVKRANRHLHTRKYGGSYRSSIALKKDTADKNRPSSTLQLPSVAAMSTELVLQRLQPFWGKVVPSAAGSLKPLIFKSDAFDLAIDQTRYPLLKAFDDGKLLLDMDGTLPQLVRTLIQEKDPSVRVVSASPSDGRRFLGALLAAGGFYSVEDQPVMIFGTDPQLKVRSDFKVERTTESVMRNEVMLVSASRQGLPNRLAAYLKSQGFELLEPFSDQVAAEVPLRHHVVHATPGDINRTVDLVLESLGLPVERNRRVELFRSVESGIALSVAADRYFERGNKRYVVARFTGDPVTYTLFRLLETKGYRVIILEPQDGFKIVTSKLLSRMDLPSSYASHQLVSDPLGRYSVQMSGFLLENVSSSGGAVILTDRPLERSVRDLLYDHGYQIQDK
jgi:hypothetical protein